MALQCSKTPTKTPTKQRNTWPSVEEKEFLIICRKMAIAEQLDNCVTTAGNEVYSFIRDGLSDRGFERRACGRSRKEWIHYTVADDVWGNRQGLHLHHHLHHIPLKLKDLDDEQENSLSLSNGLVQSISDDEGEPTVAKKIKLAGQAGSSKVVVKFQPGTKIGRKKKQR
ncbi:hypothetical protein OS493_000351 [Desmophyllum pertusum]|uniref:Uncharacterized protein n=1 Tax=Desmophyllum pertusum TaxID=174260 RepID=A0A9X0A6V0_9CNID|nr:hypothetical protein OS493_000351 [Desmophyllum pertusum]